MRSKGAHELDLGVVDLTDSKTALELECARWRTDHLCHVASRVVFEFQAKPYKFS